MLSAIHRSSVVCSVVCARAWPVILAVVCVMVGALVSNSELGCVEKNRIVKHTYNVTL